MGYSVAKFRAKAHAFRRSRAEASMASERVGSIRSRHDGGANNNATRMPKTMTGTRTMRCLDWRNIREETAIKPTSAPREYVKKIAVTVIKHKMPKIHRTQRCSSVCARKKKIGRVMFNANPKSLLSATIEFGDPKMRNAPPLRIINGAALATKIPNDPAITSTRILSCAKLSTTAIVTTVISRILETKPQRYQVSTA